MYFAENICYFIGNKDIQIFVMNNNFQKDICTCMCALMILWYFMRLILNNKIYNKMIEIFTELR